MPPLHLRDTFPTLKAFKDALHAWAIEAHFEPRILKSDTGRVRVGCKRDPNCPFVVRCNWERKTGQEPLARVTVLRDRHTCLEGLEWSAAAAQMTGLASMGVNGGMGMSGGLVNGGMNGLGHGGMGVNGGGGPGQVEIRQDGNGNIMGGARVLGPIERTAHMGDISGGNLVAHAPPKVQRNSASRLPFLLEKLPQIMNIQKETTPVEIRETILRELNAEVHLQQCRRAKTVILKKRVEEGGDGPNQPGNQDLNQPGSSLDGMGSDNANDTATQLFGNMTTNGSMNNGGMGTSGSMSSGNLNVTPNNAQQSPHHPFTLHTATSVVTPVAPDNRNQSMRPVGEQPIKCPYCINSRWMKSIQDAVEHMSMHVTV